MCMKHRISALYYKLLMKLCQHISCVIYSLVGNPFNFTQANHKSNLFNNNFRYKLKYVKANKI